jgi:hypothetical protein
MYMHAAETAVIVLAGIVLMGTTHTNSPKTDTVQLYYLETTNPNMFALEDAYTAVPTAVLPTVTAHTIALMAWYAINGTCMDPTMVKKLWLTDPTLMQRLPSPILNPVSTTLLGDVTGQNGLLTSPLCRCMVSVLQAFPAKTVPALLSERVKSASTAFKACINTNSHIPKQKQLFDGNYAVEKVQTRKTTSKISFVLIICLSFLFNFLYQQLKFEAEPFYSDTRNIIILVVLSLIITLQIFLPAIFADAAHTTSILNISALTIAPALLFHFIFMEVGWPYLKINHRKRHIHPYVFCTTLISLMAIALFENGIFDFGVLVYHGLVAHVLTFAYASVILFAHFNSKANTTIDVDLHTLVGQVAVFAGVALLVVNGVTPSYPMNCTFNIMWVLPWIYVVYVFGFSIYIEHMMETIKNPDTAIHTDVISSLYFLGNTLVIIAVLGFYTIRLWHVTFGDTTLSNADTRLSLGSSVNFAFDSNGNAARLDQYFIN